MRVTGPFDTSSRAGLRSLTALTRRCEKPSGSSVLDGKQQSFNHDDQKSSLPIQVELVCQEETRAFDPFWDGPRLLPAFAAQLMGQMIVERRDSSVSVETAYGSLHPRKALLLDRKS
jgi:hypothetical protein